MTHPVVVLDNGAATIRVGLATDAAPRTLTNAVGKAPSVPAPLVGDAVDAHADVAGLALRRPHDRGCVTDWALQRAVWGRALKLAGAPLPPRGCGLVLTQAPLTPPSVERATYDAVFGDAGFASALLVPAAELAVRAWAAEGGGDDNPDAAAALAAIVVDVGFSATTAAAVFDGRLLPATVARVDLGGKAMTNLLKDSVSLRHVDVRGEGAAVAVMKDAAAFVSLDLAADLAAAKRGERTVEWVLPDGVANLKGYARAGLPPSHPAAAPPSTAPGVAAPTAKQTIVPLSVERFMIPEAWFHPSDAGLDQGGAPAAVARALAAAHPRLRPLLASNVLVVGAGAACPGFGERLAAETAPLVDSELDLRVRVMRDPATAAWRGGRLLAGSPEYGRRAVGRGAWEARGGRR